MTRSLLKRLGAGLAGALIATSAVAVTAAAPARAADCVTTVAVQAYQPVSTFQSYNAVRASTTSTCGTPFNGTTTIQRWNGSAWVNAAHGGASYATLSGQVFTTTASYRAIYSGGSSSSNNWLPGSSRSVVVSVKRLVKVADRSTRRASKGLFKIYPAASIAKKKVTFQVKKKGKWRKYKTVRVPSNGKFKVNFKNSRKGVKYRLVLPAGGGYIKSVEGPLTATRR